ncbi:post-transcriptional regulator [Bacillus sp. REN3]|uniref:post-transcriptional regulator n=1 Tax=Bacillus sp. REN3 TaxID=2802440 RepID=UPI001AEDC20A|nr:post-transcriptional regulator [Bacillus sp. REN3]
MERSHQYGRFYEEIKPALKSKLEEFRLFGYERVTEKELWDYLTKKKWKKVKEDIHLYEVVADVLSVQAGELMNHATVEAFKLGDFSLEDEEERQKLLK